MSVFLIRLVKKYTACQSRCVTISHSIGYRIHATISRRSGTPRPQGTTRVLGRTPNPILMASDADRDGYVPNVVYTCGAVKMEDSLFIPYGFSDSGIGFISARIADVLSCME